MYALLVCGRVGKKNSFQAFCIVLLMPVLTCVAIRFTLDRKSPSTRYKMADDRNKKLTEYEKKQNQS